MRIDSLSTPDPKPVSTAELALWRVGTILNVTAIRDALSGALWLQIGQRRLPARIASGNAAGPEAGAAFKVRVLRNHPVLALEVITDHAATEDTVGDALRFNLPKQTTPALLLANLTWLTHNATAADQLPKSVTQALRQLWQALPTAQTLTDSEKLATALTQSGVFLESKLVRQMSSSQVTADLQNDIKALLLQLKAQLTHAGAHTPADAGRDARPTPLPLPQGPLAAIGSLPATLQTTDPIEQLPTLLQQTEGSLARINTTQLMNYAASQTNATVYLIELPVRIMDQAELVRFRFEHKQHPHSQESAWAVDVALDLQQHGTLHAHVTLQQRQLAIQLRSESPALVTTLEQHAHELTHALQAAGLSVQRILCLHGMPPNDSTSSTTHLLDTHV